LGKLEDAYLGENIEFHTRSLQPFHQFQEAEGSTLGGVVAGISVAISWLKPKLLRTEAKVELARGMLNEDNPPSSFGVLNAKALRLDSDGCGHVQKCYWQTIS
jgi:hypothetical protein